MKVELDDTHWEKIFSRSKRWFQSKKGVLAMGLFNGSSPIDYPADCLEVLDIVSSNNSDSCGSLGALLTLGFFPDIVPADWIGRGGIATTTFSGFSTYVQVIEQLEKIKRLFNADADWYVAARKIFLTQRGGTGPVLLFYKKKNWEIEELYDRDEDMFYRYCLNEAKYILGRIRIKYRSYPSAGGTVEMDGADLLEEWKTDRELLDEEIAQSQMPISFITG